MSRNPIPHQRPYDRRELLADAIIHGGALTAAACGAVFVLAHAAGKDAVQISGLIVYVCALIAMLGFSAAYNLTPPSPVKWFLRRLDHSAIYLMIAGTYTPLLLHLPHSALAIALAAIVWGGAVLGIALKVLRPGRHDTLAILIYLGLGWAAVFAMSDFIRALPLWSVILIGAGGLIYSAGVPFYLWDRLRFQNAIWHGFVVAAAACHFVAISLLYV